MKKFRVGALTALAVAATALSAAAPASASTSAAVPPPPCTPAIPVPQAVDCTFEIARWAVSIADPAFLVEEAREVTFATLAAVEAQVQAALVTVDNVEKFAVGTACFVMGIPPEECPDI